eukprot:TRINITY_DN3937_c0_g1_i2.p2 TRINITY_DN3937_c0_g1~~TRINITY_DN3937_c0_g1_i2.p2  ORF type:complete len:103 (+),score=20.28 TRINITY_DN3937_c0_g1_i2:38-346(+)
MFRFANTIVSSAVNTSSSTSAVLARAMPRCLFSTTPQSFTANSIKIWGPNDQEVMSDELFGQGKMVVFGAPGAFTGTCTNMVPAYDKLAGEFQKHGFNVYCL